MPQVAGVWKGEPPNAAGTRPSRSIWFCLLPYVEQDNLYKAQLATTTVQTGILVKTYVSPADPTGNGSTGGSSYAANWQVFQAPAALSTTAIASPSQNAAIPRTFPDGTTSVILYAEIYQSCNIAAGAAPTATGGNRLWGVVSRSNDSPSFNRNPTSPNPSLVNPNLVRFQVQPKQLGTGTGICDPAAAQTPHAGGMLVCLGDGSVRVIAASLSDLTWRRVCAPADGETLGSDW